jgi:glucose-6-phosphate isomerase
MNMPDATTIDGLTFRGAMGPVPDPARVGELAEQAGERMAGLYRGPRADLGWLDPGEHASVAICDKINTLAAEIKERAEVFVLVGVGGSNNGARAVLKALRPRGPEILYGGTNLSPLFMQRVLDAVEHKSVYINVIAKNFATLEPGIAFRFLRQAMEKKYGTDAKNRIIVTGSIQGDALFRFARERDYRFFEFPQNIGGRYSAVSSVGLLPMAAGGIDINELTAGTVEMAAFLKNAKVPDNPALAYAAARNALLEKGYTNEILASFEPDLAYFAKWFVQLFGESEGKEGKGIFPSSCNFSEDLHSLGQYIQQGRRMVMETFIRVAHTGLSLPVPAEPGDPDLFGYLDGKDLGDINRAGFDATLKAHSEGGVPCMVVDIPDISPRTFGGLFYFFEYACAASGYLLGINPFDQPGVEAYKHNLFAELRGENL